MRNKHYGTAIILATVLLTSCAGPRKEPSPPANPPEAAQFGFDPVSTDIAWRVGDQAVFELTIFDGEEESRFYVCCEVAPQPEGGNWPKDLPTKGKCTYHYTVPSGKNAEFVLNWKFIYIEIERRDANFQTLGTTNYVLPMQLFEKGTYDACQLVQGINPEDPASIREAQLLEIGDRICFISTTLGAYEMLLYRPGLRDLANMIVFRCIRPNVLFAKPEPYKLRIDLDDGIEQPSITEFHLPASLKEAYSYQVTGILETLFGERPIAEMRITVVPPMPPFLLTGGVVLVEGKPIQESNRWFRIRLVSARRGAGDVVRRVEQETTENEKQAAAQAASDSA